MQDRLVRFSQKRSGKVQHVSGWFGPEAQSPVSRVRVWPFSVLVVAVIMILFGRLAQLTLVEGAYRRDMADENRVIAIRRAAARGILFDTDGEPLVRNVPIYKRQVPGTTLAQGQFEEITHDEAVQLNYDPGERVFFDIHRNYLCGEACSVLLGFIGEVDADELERGESYVMGDMIGKAGLENAYEDALRGRPGSELVEVNAQGELVREIGRTYPEAGIDMHLTIDSGLQRLLYEALDGRAGAAVAQVPDTGEILAMVSSPAYDPNNIAAYLKAEEMPFFNRSIGGVYPPGSLFKVVTAVAGLEEEVITPTDTYQDVGEIEVNGYTFGNWYYHEYGRTEGEVNVTDAMRRSNDIFFYKLSGDLGVNALAEWARVMGYEDDAGLGAWGAKLGTVPDPTWKERTKGERWFLGNTYHMSIGQGDVLASPLQVNRMMGAIAARGSICDPVVAKSEVGRKSCRQLNLKAETVEVVHESLVQACEPGGTGAPLFDFEPRVACKTGTAESGATKDEMPHAWFGVYAPANDPEIVLTVLVERSGQGSEVAAPIAREAMEYWFYGDTELAEDESSQEVDGE